MSIEVNGIESFLKTTKSSKVSSEIVNAILRRIDSTGDGEITFKDFKKFLTPFKEQRLSKVNKSVSSFSKSLLDKENSMYSHNTSVLSKSPELEFDRVKQNFTTAI
jgi:hypothetical protein